VATPGHAVASDTQLALPLELPEAPRLRPLSRWQRLLADYASSGVTVDDHVMAALRPRLRASMLATSAQLPRLPHGCSVTVAGLVIARQRPGTAKGIMFLLFEDEWGTINLIVPRAVYEAQRALARAEPLLLARGRLERSPEGVLNVIVRELAALERFVDAEEPSTEARVHRLPISRSAMAEGDEEDGAEVGAGMRAVAPPVQSFGTGRRR
jgi:error-prone DNA polymerase